MAFTEAEILQKMKTHVDTKKLNVSEITMQKRAAQLAAQLEKLNLTEGEDEFISSELSFLDVIHDNIRHERSIQKKEDDELFKKANPKPSEPIAPPDDISPEIVEIKKELEALKNAKSAESRQLEVRKRIYELGIPKTDEDIAEAIFGTQVINHETDVESVAGAIVNTYNKLKTLIAAPAMPAAASGSPVSKEFEKLLEDAKNFR